jgi:superfamily II DNA or RNA helicase
MAKVTLFDDQNAVLDMVRDAFKAGHQSVMLYAPTGAGKTEMAISMLQATADKLNNAAMVLDRIVLCNQTSARLDKYSIDHGVLQAGHWRHRPYERIQVCSAQTLEKRGSFPGLKLLIVDEAHTQRQQTTEFIRNNPSVRVIGLSASPFSEGLGKTYSKVVSATTTADLVAKQRLTPLRVFIAKEVDMTGAKKVAGEWSQDEASSRAMQITGDVVAEWIKKTTEIFGKPRKTIVFCSGVAHGADLAQRFADAGYNFVPISYKDSDEFKADAVKEFSKPDTDIHGLIATDILTKGFDVPDVMIGVSARPFSKSFSSHVQQMGRVMRAHQGKDFAVWLDHSGNYLRFQEDWDELYHNGVSELSDGKEKTKKEKTDNEKEAAKCPKCGALWIGKSDNCAVCGYHRPLRNLVDEVPGAMEELAGGVATRDSKQEWYSQLITAQRKHGYSDGWTAHKYRAKFGVWPRGLHDTPAPITPAMAGWLKAQQIAWTKSKKA